MKKEIRQEIERKFRRVSRRVRVPEAPPRKTISEEERRIQTTQYAELLFKSALRDLGH